MAEETNALERLERRETAATAIEPASPLGMETLRKSFGEKLNDDQLAFFAQVCQRTGLDPFSKQIYAVPRKDRKTGRYEMTVQTGIDGYRAIAAASGEYRGQRGPYWCGEDGRWREVWTGPGHPLAAKVEVLHAHFDEPLTGVATWAEYAQHYNGQPSGMWKTYPTVMLAKCAEANALRRAFPRQLSGVYTSGEMADQPETYDAETVTQAEVSERLADAAEIAEIEDLCNELDVPSEKLHAAVGKAAAGGGRFKPRSPASLSASEVKVALTYLHAACDKKRQADEAAKAEREAAAAKAAVADLEEREAAELDEDGFEVEPETRGGDDASAR